MDKLVKFLATAMILLFVATVTFAAPDTDDMKRPGPTQASVASSKPFGLAKLSDVAKAIDAKDLKSAVALEGKKGTLQGTVSNVFCPRSNSVVILDFAEEYNDAVTVVVFAKDFKKFPDLTKLNGKHVLLTGKFKAYHDKPEVEISEPKDISILP